MGVTVEVSSPDRVQADVLAVPVADTGNGLAGQPKLLDERLHGRLSRLAAEGELKRELGETLSLYLDGELDARRVVAVALGPVQDLDADALRTAAPAVGRTARG